MGLTRRICGHGIAAIDIACRSKNFFGILSDTISASCLLFCSLGGRVNSIWVAEVLEALFQKWGYFSSLAQFLVCLSMHVRSRTLILSVFILGGGYPRYSGSSPGREKHHWDAGNNSACPSSFSCPVRHGYIRAVWAQPGRAARTLQQYQATVCQQGGLGFNIWCRAAAFLVIKSRLDA